MSSTHNLYTICQNYQHVLSGIWANDKTVREALHIRVVRESYEL